MEMDKQDQTILRVTCLIHMLDVTHSNVWHDSYTHSYVWHVSFVTLLCDMELFHPSFGVVREGTFHGLNNLKRIESVFWEREERTGTPLRCTVSKCDAVCYSALQRGIGWCSRCNRTLQVVSTASFFKTRHAQFPPNVSRPFLKKIKNQIKPVTTRADCEWRAAGPGLKPFRLPHAPVIGSMPSKTDNSNTHGFDLHRYPQSRVLNYCWK